MHFYLRLLRLPLHYAERERLGSGPDPRLKSGAPAASAIAWGVSLVQSCGKQGICSRGGYSSWRCARKHRMDPGMGGAMLLHDGVALVPSRRASHPKKRCCLHCELSRHANSSGESSGRLASAGGVVQGIFSKPSTAPSGKARDEAEGGCIPLPIKVGSGAPNVPGALLSSPVASWDAPSRGFGASLKRR